MSLIFKLFFRPAVCCVSRVVPAGHVMASCHLACHCLLSPGPGSGHGAHNRRRKASASLRSPAYLFLVQLLCPVLDS